MIGLSTNIVCNASKNGGSSSLLFKGIFTSEMGRAPNCGDSSNRLRISLSFCESKSYNLSKSVD